MNASGVIQSASDSIEQVFGWTPTELLGCNVKVLIPEPRRSSLDRYRHADRTKSQQRTRRFDALRKDGSVFAIELSMSRADLPAHAAPFFIGIVRDVSGAIDVGQDTKGERARLQELITEQTRALASANLRLHLADRLASLGTLAAGLGHDMNNVLLPVRARLDALEHAATTPAARGHITAVRRSLSYLQHLSDGLHFLAQNPEGHGAANNDGTTDLAHWWSQVGTLLRTMISKRVALSAALPAHLPPLAMAPHWLTQAMLNLIVNAAEAIPAGRQGRVRVWATIADNARAVTVGVTDNGRGMTPAIRKRALDLFFTTKPRGMGTGLGLPLAEKVAARAGGALEITSHPGKGTTVTMRIPVSGRGAGRVRSPNATNRSATVSVRDPRTAALISHVLLKAGVTLQPATAGRPGTSNLWVTEPSPTSLAAATRWRKRRPRRSIVLLGAPSTRSRSAWAALGATVIDQVDDFEAIRYALGQTLDTA